MRRNSFSYQPLSSDLAALLLRLSFGGLIIHRGYMKLMSFNEILPIFPDPIGIGSQLSLILVIFAELFCGILVAVGLLTRYAVIPIFVAMTVAYFIVHAKDPFDAKTLPFLFWLLSIVIFVLGSGKFSMDKLLFKQRRRR